MIDELISACFSEFCDIAGDSPCGCDACPYGRTNDDCYAIYEHDKLTTLEKKGITPLKWIPVSERLPEKMKDVLVWSHGGDFAEVAFWEGGRWEKTWDHEVIYAVTHWIPLPEPPKDGEG